MNAVSLRALRYAISFEMYTANVTNCIWIVFIIVHGTDRQTETVLHYEVGWRFTGIETQKVKKREGTFLRLKIAIDCNLTMNTIFCNMPSTLPRLLVRLCGSDNF